MNKQALVDWVNEKVGGTKADSERLVTGMFDAIMASVKGGQDVSIAGFGIFTLKRSAARTARNPKTGASVQVAAKNSPKFRAAKAFKELVK